MATAYERMLKISYNVQTEEIVYNAINNLKTIEEIQEFVQEYSVIRYERWKNDIAYALGHFTQQDRELWHQAVGDIIGINIQWNRSPRELYTKFEFIDEKGQIIPPKENIKGLHQSK